MGVYLQSVLNSIGYKATVKPISGNISFTYVQNTKNKVQISVPQWYQDYPLPRTSSTSCSAASRSTPAATRASTSRAAATSRSTPRCTRRSTPRSRTSRPRNVLWAKIDKQVTDQAPMATLFTRSTIDFVSKRVGNFIFSKQFYWLVDQSWVQ